MSASCFRRTSDLRSVFCSAEASSQFAGLFFLFVACQALLWLRCGVVIDHPWLLVMLFLAGLLGGFIDSIAGGGGLITLPALLAAGVSPGVALGTNKFQSVFGTAMAVHRFAGAGLMRIEGLPWAVALAFGAGMAGAWSVSLIDPDLLRMVIPWLLAAVGIYTAINRRFGLHPGAGKLSPWVFAVVFGTGLGFYDGVFGPGTGSFWTVAVVTLLGLDLMAATGYTKAANLASNLGSLAVFLCLGSVHFWLGLVMIGGQLIGARLGSGLVIERGARLIRPVFLSCVFVMTLKLFWDLWRD